MLSKTVRSNAISAQESLRIQGWSSMSAQVGRLAGSKVKQSDMKSLAVVEIPFQRLPANENLPVITRNVHFLENVSLFLWHGLKCIDFIE